ncbi:hypothetical protein RA955_05660 [Geobacillus proteiniphilus]|uniref:Uncharacterized protein n=1 Tax=Geobacillus proteiniphilus TaxID=860353 RepID=A0A1Q5T5C8_9BACL|nr:MULTISPECIES: hypothetical protein [Geobacillus]OKO95433.1 hypothetical protein BRO54_0868 [Geobacillus proteiniphilus]WMJ17551.1 hypothetical protein RA955_05660 [Geobacillus proteiniphilus]
MAAGFNQRERPPVNSGTANEAPWSSGEHARPGYCGVGWGWGKDVGIVRNP